MGCAGSAERVVTGDALYLAPSPPSSALGRPPPPSSQLATVPALTDADATAGTALATALVGRLLGDKSQPSLPVRSHAERLSSGERGLSLAALRGLRAFFAAHDRLDVTMENVCKEVGCETSVCALTRSTGLSLAESVVVVAAERGKDTSA